MILVSSQAPMVHFPSIAVGSPRARDGSHAMPSSATAAAARAAALASAAVAAAARQRPWPVPWWLRPPPPSQTVAFATIGSGFSFSSFTASPSSNNDQSKQQQAYKQINAMVLPQGHARAENLHLLPPLQAAPQKTIISARAVVARAPPPSTVGQITMHGGVSPLVNGIKSPQMFATALPLLVTAGRLISSSWGTNPVSCPPLGPPGPKPPTPPPSLSLASQNLNFHLLLHTSLPLPTLVPLDDHHPEETAVAALGDRDGLQNLASVPCPPPFSQQQENSRFTSDRTADSSAGWLIWGKGKWRRRIIGGATASVAASGKSGGGGSNGCSYGGGRCRIEQRLHSTSKPPPPPHLHSTPSLHLHPTSTQLLDFPLPPPPLCADTAPWTLVTSLGQREAGSGARCVSVLTCSVMELSKSECEAHHFHNIPFVCTVHPRYKKIFMRRIPDTRRIFFLTQV